MAVIKIKKGRDLPIEGAPSADISNAANSSRFSLLPPDFYGLKFKLEVKEGDKVKAGSPLMSNRAVPQMLFTSPAGGTVCAINRGERRKLLEIVIEKSQEEEFESFDSFEAKDIASLGAERIKQQLLASGVWPCIRQRPFSKVANPSQAPKSIFINAMDTEPNTADINILLQGREREFQAGVDIIKQLTTGKVFLCSDARTANVAPAISGAQGAESHQFSGPHPAGNVGTHIQHLDPINKGDVVWYLNAQNAADIGKLFLTGRLPVNRLVALCGSAARQRQYYHTRLGAELQSIIQDRVEGGDVRIINGGVLTGTQSSVKGYLGFYNSTITIIPEAGPKELFGWMKPGLSKPTFSRMFLSAFRGGTYNIDTCLNGEDRAIVASHVYDSLVALDVLPSFLIKACLAQDVEEMEQLGLFECAPEDFSLCTYACISKTNVDSIIRDGLDLLEKES